MSRAFLIVLDSVGIGGAPDADQYFNEDRPDTGANTLGHIGQWCILNRKQPKPQLALKTLESLGLWHAVHLSTGLGIPVGTPAGRWGVAREVSKGKDTPSGHWEIAGVPLE